MKMEPTEIQPGVFLRAYAPGDEFVINGLFNRVFKTRRGLNEWTGKFGPSCARGEILLLTDKDGEILAHYAATDWSYHLDGQVIHSGHALDVFALSGGLLGPRGFSRLQKAFFEIHGRRGRWPLIFGFPGDRAHRLGKATGGHHNTGRLQRWQRPATTPGIPKGWSIGKAPEDAAAERIWSSARRRLAASVVRDGAYLRTRYPDERYRILTARRFPGFLHPPAAWAVLAVDPGGQTWWADLCWDGEDVAALDTLASAACRHAGEAGPALWLSGDRLVENRLAATGWTRIAREGDPFFTYRAFPPLAPDALDTFVPYLTAGDTDLL